MHGSCTYCKQISGIKGEDVMCVIHFFSRKLIFVEVELTTDVYTIACLSRNKTS